MGFKCRIPLVKLLLNNKQRQNRLTWAKGEKNNWSVAQWWKVLFSDKSKFCISFGNQDPRVWRKNGEAHNPRCLKSSVTFPQSVLIWGAMSSAGVGPLCFIKSRVRLKVIEASWSSITPQQCHRLMASMPRRIEAVIHAYTSQGADISIFKILFFIDFM